MDLIDENCITTDYGLLPEHVRAALMEFWDDNESENINVARVVYWLERAVHEKSGR